MGCIFSPHLSLVTLSICPCGAQISGIWNTIRELVQRVFSFSIVKPIFPPLGNANELNLSLTVPSNADSFAYAMPFWFFLLLSDSVPGFLLHLYRCLVSHIGKLCWLSSWNFSVFIFLRIFSHLLPLRVFRSGAF